MARAAEESNEEDPGELARTPVSQLEPTAHSILSADPPSLPSARARLIDACASSASTSGSHVPLASLDALAACSASAIDAGSEDDGMPARRARTASALASAARSSTADPSCASAGLLRFIRVLIESSAEPTHARRQRASSLASLCAALAGRLQLAQPLSHCLLASASTSESCARIAASSCSQNSHLAFTLLSTLCSWPASEFARLAAHNSASVRALASLLPSLALSQPSAAARCASSLQQHLADDAYALRAAIVTAFVTLLCSSGSLASQSESLNASLSIVDNDDDGDGQQLYLRQRMNNEENMDAEATESTDETGYGDAHGQSYNDATSNNAESERPFELNASTKQSLLEILCERVHDAHSVVRTRSTQALHSLVEQRLLPISYWLPVCDLATARLMDKAQAVRKAAMRCVCAMVQYNPFAPALPVNAFESTLREYSEALYARNQNESDNNDKQHGDGSATAAAADEFDGASSSSPAHLPLDKLRSLVASLDVAATFAKRLRDTVPSVCMLLDQGATGDATEASPLVVLFSHFQIDGSVECVRRMLALVFSRDEQIRDTVVSCADELFLSSADDPHEAASSLVALVQGAPLGSRMAVEHIMERLVRNGKVNTDGGVLAKSLWVTASGRGPGKDDAESQAAAFELLSYLAPASSAEAMLHQSRLQVLRTGIESDHADSVRWAIALISNLPCTKETIERTNALLDRIVYTVLSPNSTLQGRSWFAAAEVAVDAIYNLHPAPEHTLASALGRMTSSPSHQQAPDDSRTAKRQHAGPREDEMTVEHMARLVALTGAVAIRHVSYTEHIASKQRTEERKANASKAAQHNEYDNDDRADGNLAVQVGVDSESAAADAEAQREAAERQLLHCENGCGRSGIVATLAPIVVHACTDAGLLCSSSLLRGVATLALMRLMAVDRQFCASNLRLLFTRLKAESLEGVRATGAIGLGDLAYRHPNELEPWTEHLYGKRSWCTGLHDRAESARRQSLAVLSHLALADMMKVRSYVSKIALRIVDDSSRIASLASYFFTELSKKPSEPLYNLLPDILSNLSQEVELSEQSFKSVMQSLLNLIGKEKQREKLVPKVCTRVGEAAESNNFALARSLAYCASRLPLGEHGFRKLEGSFKMFESAITDRSVAEYIKDAARTCIASKSKSGKSDSGESNASLRRGRSNARSRKRIQRNNDDGNTQNADDQDGVQSELEKAVEAFCARVESCVIESANDEEGDRGDNGDSSEDQAGRETKRAECDADSRARERLRDKNVRALADDDDDVIDDQDADERRSREQSTKPERNIEALKHETSDAHDEGEQQQRAQQGAGAAIKSEVDGEENKENEHPQMRKVPDERQVLQKKHVETEALPSAG